jgi:predicted transcriptional regulator
MNSLENSRELAENKTILLYVIQSLDLPVTNLEITKIILENKLMNYIFLQQYLDELCEAKFLDKKDVDNKLAYIITPSGKQSLDYFTSLIPGGIKSRITEAISSYKKRIKYETKVEADCTAVSENEFIANLRITEGSFTFIDLKLAVGSRNDANSICTTWTKNSEQIYKKIINIFTEMTH